MTQNSHDPDALTRTGLLHLHAGRFNVAIECFREGLSARPQSPALWSHLGIALEQSGKSEQALEAFRKACALRPGSAELWSNLGNALRNAKRLDEAEEACRKAIALNPQLPDAHGNLGNILLDQGWGDAAIEEFQRLVQLRPQVPDGYYNLGNALLYSNRASEAATAFKKAVELRPNFVEALTNLGYALRSSGETDESLRTFERAAAADPSRVDLLINLATGLKDTGRLRQAVETLRRAVQLAPQNSQVHSGLIFFLQYCETDPKVIGDELRLWNQRHARPLKSGFRRDTDASPDRRLRIGYVSPDLCDQPTGRMVASLVAEHDRGNFEMFCYSDVTPDRITRQLQSQCDGWCDARALGDEELAGRIFEDRIDILVDLAVHAGNNRLLVFARKPAPVQATFFGYPGSTGLETMDYRLTDSYLDPPGADESDYSEISIRVAHTYWPYHPPDDSPEVGELPASRNGFITFGCLNNFCKAGEETLRLWGRILKAIPNSRLRLLCPPGSHRDGVTDAIGVEPARIFFVPPQRRSFYLKEYEAIDVGLDTFPYNGHTTSLDSLWLGVPVVTLKGRAAVGRGGVSILSNVGLKELIAEDTDRYVEIAVELANDRQRLTDLRRDLRGRMLRSPLMNASLYARDIESAYRAMWRHCARTRQ